MANTVKLNHNLVSFGLPALAILLIVFLVWSPVFRSHEGLLSFGVTVDLLFTVPLCYFLLIRKRNIPNITVVPFFVLGTWIASYILPREHHDLLNLAKNWVLPLVEMTVLVTIAYKVNKVIKHYKAHKGTTPDLFTALKNACNEILPGKVAEVFATEVAVLYYGFIYWKNRPLKNLEFSYHKNSGTPALLVSIICIALIEAAVIHLLIQHWNNTLAWVLTAVSIYSAIQVFGILKSMHKRPILITNNTLHLRYGIFNEANLPLLDIEKVELSSKDLNFKDTTTRLSPLGEIEGHNVIIHLKKENTLLGFYGIRRNIKTIAFHIDDKEGFKKTLEAILPKSKS